MQVTYKKLYLIALIFISGFMLLLSNDDQIIVHVFAIFVLAFGSCAVSNFDLFHPLCWFPPFYALYSSAYAILYLVGYNTKYGYSKEGLVYSWIGLAVFLICISTKKVSIIISRHDNTGNSLGRLVLLLLDSYIFIAMVFISRGSFFFITQIYNSQNGLILLSFRITYLAIILFSNELYKGLKNPGYNNKGILISSFSLISLFGLLTGERDYLFSVILITIILLYFGKKLSNKVIIGMVPLGVIMLPLSHYYKYYLLDNIVAGKFDTSNILVEFLDGEFISAGRNLQILINNHYYGYWKGKSLLNDLLIPFYHTGFSIQTWFNDTFFSPDNPTKYGFTLVGEGYSNFGIIGIVLVYAALALLTGFLYKYSQKNRYFMIVYIYMIPIIIYCTRADFANVLSPLLHYAVLGAMVAFILDRVDIIRSEKEM